MTFLNVFQSLHARIYLTTLLMLHLVISRITFSPLWTARNPSSLLHTSGSMSERPSLPSTSQHPCSSSPIIRSSSKHLKVQSNAVLMDGPPINWMFISTLPWLMVSLCYRSAAQPAVAMVQKTKHPFCTFTPAQVALTAPAGHPKSHGHQMPLIISEDLHLRALTAEESR